MPDTAMWESFFDPQVIVRTFAKGRDPGHILEIGCGYGTFSVPLAQATSLVLTAVAQP